MVIIQLIYLIIEEKKNFRKMIASQSETKVEFTKISKIGADVILVDL